jgi:hypothetical protein
MSGEAGRGMTHAEAEELLPWLVNGSLSGAEAQALRDHLDGCAACRSALRAEQRLAAAVARRDPRDQAEEATWRRLRSRIAPEPRLPATVRRAAWAVLPLAAALLLAAVLLPAVRAPFVTVTAPEPPLAQAMLRASLVAGAAPEATAALFAANGLRVVAGPSAGGVYTLAAPSQAAAEAAAAALRASPLVGVIETAPP